MLAVPPLQKNTPNATRNSRDTAIASSTMDEYWSHIVIAVHLA